MLRCGSGHDGLASGRESLVFFRRAESLSPGELVGLTGPRFGPEDPVHECAICRHLGLPPRVTESVIGIRTEIPDVVNLACSRLGVGHVMLPACPEHVVKVYRGELAGVEMAWQVVAPPERLTDSAVR